MRTSDSLPVLWMTSLTCCCTAAATERAPRHPGPARVRKKWGSMLDEAEADDCFLAAFTNFQPLRPFHSHTTAGPRLPVAFSLCAATHSLSSPSRHQRQQQIFSTINKAAAYTKRGLKSITLRIPSGGVGGQDGVTFELHGSFGGFEDDHCTACE